jgi:hypothetical protein
MLTESQIIESIAKMRTELAISTQKRVELLGINEGNEFSMCGHDLKTLPVMIGTLEAALRGRVYKQRQREPELKMRNKYLCLIIGSSQGFLDELMAARERWLRDGSDTHIIGFADPNASIELLDTETGEKFYGVEAIHKIITNPVEE